MMKQVLVFRHVPHEGLGTIERFLKTRNICVQYCDLFGDQSPPLAARACDYVISMGGPMNADETDLYPFLARERRFIQVAVRCRVPVLGICLGAQMIARSLGARVYAGRQKEIGWYDIELTEKGLRDAAFRGIRESKLTVFQWHGDTFDLPKGAVSLAASRLFQHQAFRFQDHVYALQFHIEVTGEMIRDWIVQNSAELSELKGIVDPAEIVGDITRYEPTLRERSARIYPTLFSTLIGANRARILNTDQTLVRKR